MQTRKAPRQFIELRVSNLRVAVAAASFTLVIGSMVIEDHYSGMAIFCAVIFAAFLSSIAYLSRFNYRRASASLIVSSLLVGAPAAALYVLVDGEDRPILGLWAAVNIVLAVILFSLRQQRGDGHRGHSPDV